jgi:succinyl-diaminopimelate desuccinylase
MNSATEILQQLIRIPSVNPDGEPGTTATGEAVVAAWVADYLTHLGAKVRLEEVLPGRPNVIGNFPTNGSGKPKIILGPHLDTVSVGGMVIDPFGGEIRDGRIWGRGASDTKGTAAAMLEALRRLGPAVADLGAEITFVGFMGEESAQYGSKHFAKKYPGAFDFSLVGEPTENKVVHTHKGCLWAELKTTGKAAHGSMPDQGENAITKMLPAIAWLDTAMRTRLANAAFDHAQLGHSTLNIGMIRGGTRTNIVPDACTLSLDFRVTPALFSCGLETWIPAQFAEQPWAKDVVLKCFESCPPLDTPTEHPLVQKLAAAGNGLTHAPWFCDAVWLAQGGIPSVAAGPGSIAQAHTADEFLAIPDLEAGVAFYQRFLESL